ncbi:5-oxoprolinase subunit B family protein [Aeromicrobium sp.]|uniref:5-oxoprolinase subunit B family protein n=1 Tax=Aeromicrobium sp. TaxID=1871063 RepID=UPI003C3EA760
MNIRPCGDTALLLDCGSLAEAQIWFEALRNEADVVLGARSVLLRGRPADLRALVARTSLSEPSGPGVVEQVEIDVVYDGPDLDEVARLTGLTSREVIAAHTGSSWRVAFGGFAPGFSYLVDGDCRLQVPRRASPRISVPAGSVGLAGEFSGIYPRESPGGWQLLGRTATTMWDSGREPPALLHPGMAVRFVAS